MPTGRFADRLAALRSMRVSATGGILIRLGTAAFVRGWATLVGALATAGMVQAITQPAGRQPVRRPLGPADPARPGRGLKQSGPPIMTMLAGTAVPISSS